MEAASLVPALCHLSEALESVLQRSNARARTWSSQASIPQGGHTATWAFQNNDILCSCPMLCCCCFVVAGEEFAPMGLEPAVTQLHHQATQGTDML